MEFLAIVVVLVAFPFFGLATGSMVFLLCLKWLSRTVRGPRYVGPYRAKFGQHDMYTMKKPKSLC